MSHLLPVRWLAICCCLPLKLLGLGLGCGACHQRQTTWVHNSPTTATTFKQSLARRRDEATKITPPPSIDAANHNNSSGHRNQAKQASKHQFVAPLCDHALSVGEALLVLAVPPAALLSRSGFVSCRLSPSPSPSSSPSPEAIAIKVGPSSPPSLFFLPPT